MSKKFALAAAVCSLLAVNLAVAAIAPSPVVAPASTTPPASEPAAPIATPAPIAAAESPSAPVEFLSTVTIACPATATRTTFPLVANTLLQLETVDPVSAKTSHPGDRFALRVREPLRYGAVELVPAGAFVQGEVFHAAKSRFGGQAGELNLAARYVQLPQGRIKLRASFAAAGKTHDGAVAATTILFGIAGLPFMAIHGSNPRLDAGTALTARLADPVTFRCEGADASSPPNPSTPAVVAPGSTTQTNH